MMFYPVSHTKFWVGILFVLLCPAARAVIVGHEPGENTMVDLRYVEGSDFHYELPLTEVNATPGAPYWIKNLLAEGVVPGEDRPVLMPGDTITFVEHFRLVGETPLSNWHEVFSVRGWSFDSGLIYLDGSDEPMEGQPISGGDGPDSFHEILFSFDPLPAGSILRLEHVLRYDGIDSMTGIEPWGDDTIVIRQYPTVIPEPATLGMIGAGAGLMNLARRCRVRHRRLIGC